jgi:hypothetical protein
MAVKVAGKRVLQSFQTFAAAKIAAEAKLRQIAKGNQSAALTTKEATDALNIRDALQGFYCDTGRRVAPLTKVISPGTRTLAYFHLVVDVRPHGEYHPPERSHEVHVEATRKCDRAAILSDCGAVCSDNEYFVRPSLTVAG